MEFGFFTESGVLIFSDCPTHREFPVFVQDSGSGFSTEISVLILSDRGRVSRVGLVESSPFR